MGPSIVASMGFVTVPRGGVETERFEGTPPRKPPPSLHSFSWQEAPRQQSLRPRAEGIWVGGVGEGAHGERGGNGKGVKRDPSIFWGGRQDMLDVSESDSEGKEVHLPVLSRKLLPSSKRYAYPRNLEEASEGQGGGQGGGQGRDKGGRDKGGRRGISDEEEDGSSNEDEQVMSLALQSMKRHSA